jgi:hypothetical protein
MHICLLFKSLGKLNGLFNAEVLTHHEIVAEIESKFDATAPMSQHVR